VTVMVNKAESVLHRLGFGCFVKRTPVQKNLHFCLTSHSISAIMETNRMMIMKA